MTPLVTTRRAVLAAAFALLCSVGVPPVGAGQPAAARPQLPLSPEPLDDQRPDFVRMVRDQAETDRAWQEASAGFMRMEKISFRNPVGDLDIPAFVFLPLRTRGPRAYAALVWVHENIRGHLYEHYIPYIREATERGFVVIAPEYRGSIGYGKRFYDAIDYGGAEVTDVVMAGQVLATRYAEVDPARLGIIGWSHGGMIALLSVARSPGVFRAGAAMQPVTNLFHRMARKGVDRLRRAIDPQNRMGGPPSERPEAYRDRSPLFQVYRFQIPLLVHMADNDEDVTIDEAMQLVDALRARKVDLADVKVYRSPPGGHTFDRRVVPGTWEPANTPEQRDSWARVWTFLENHLLSYN
jgi:dipeptidyl aminopeptidase/acylaminoacyl peptidase